MAWEWVAPVVTGVVGVAGVAFTWLTARESRQHLEEMADKNFRLTVLARRDSDRQNAYISIMRVAELDLRRNRYRREGETEKLAQIEAKWTKPDRAAMSQEATILIELYGSSEARSLVRAWQSAVHDDDYDRMNLLYNEFCELAREELGKPVESPTSMP
jgi:hypothetical protein